MKEDFSVKELKSDEFLILEKSEALQMSQI